MCFSDGDSVVLGVDGDVLKWDSAGFPVMMAYDSAKMSLNNFSKKYAMNQHVT